MQYEASDPAQFLRSAGLPADIDSPEVLVRQFALSRAVVELVRSVPADRQGPSAAESRRP